MNIILVNFLLPFLQAWTNGAAVQFRGEKCKIEHSLETSSDSSVVPAAVIAESPYVIVVHDASKPQSKAREGSFFSKNLFSPASML